jgi:prepilin-type N-terminal cleavage/methylation domain-containing protein
MALAKSSWTADRRAGAAGARGFSLLEVLFATTILVVGVAGLAQLFALSTRTNSSARATTFASLLAQEKMEQLRSLTWGFDSLGLPLTDTSTNISSATQNPTGGRGLTPSPVGTLGSNTDGYCDYLDGTGKSLGSGSNPPNGAVYIRRWSIEPLPTNPNNTLVLQVLVTRNRTRGASDTATGVNRLPDEARIISVKTRKAS